MGKCMGSRLGLRKGAWTHEEDILLKICVENFGEGKWHQVPTKAGTSTASPYLIDIWRGLNRCRKSCRLRWLNYLKPNIKRGQFTTDEIDLIGRLHKLLGNRWSLISGRLPGRTANDVKNYWNTHLRKEGSYSTSNNKSEHQKVKDNLNSTLKSSHIIRPRPRTFSKNFSLVITDQKNINDQEIESCKHGNIVDQAELNKATTSSFPSSDHDDNDRNRDHAVKWWESLLVDVESCDRDQGKGLPLDWSDYNWEESVDQQANKVEGDAFLDSDKRVWRDMHADDEFWGLLDADDHHDPAIPN